MSEQGVLDLHDDARTLRVEIRFKNARLWQALQDRCAGAARLLHKGGVLPILKTASELSGVKRAMIEQALSLRWSPVYSGNRSYRRRGTWKPAALALAETLDMPVEELFPLEMYQLAFPKLIAGNVEPIQFISLASPEAKLLTAPESHSIDLVGLHKALDEICDTLKPQEARVLNARFGLDGGEPQTYEEIAPTEGVGKGRIRQIEMKALRKLRHPSRSRHLQAWV